MIINFKPITAINNTSDNNGLGSVSRVFYMSETPISNTTYCNFLNSLPEKEQKQNIYYQQKQLDIVYDNGFKVKNKLTGHYPATNINILDMLKFLRWLKKIDSKSIYYLPTLNEWYKAAYYNPKEKIYYNFPNRQNNIENISNKPDCPFSINVENLFQQTIKNKYFIYNYSFFDIRDLAGNTYEFISSPNPNYQTIVGSSWNRHRLNAHKDNCGNRKVSKKYKSNYIGFRICKTCPSTTFFVSLHNEFGDGWKQDSISIHDTNHGTIKKDITLQQGYESELIELELFNYIDNYIIIEYHSKTNFFYENTIKIYNKNQEMIGEYNFKRHNDKIIASVV